KFKLWSNSRRCRSSTVVLATLMFSLASSLLTLAAKTLTDFNSEFQDDSQKDAHEFLSCVLNMIQSLSFDLQMAAAVMGVTYTCPVDAHMSFKMLNIRTCKGCGCQSMTEEQYLNLSLVPADSVSQSLQEYLKEGQLEFHCSCGVRESTKQLSFLTLPNVLIIQLIRFRFTSTFCLEKDSIPTELSRELVVNPENTIIQTGTRYSLVSIISHLGPTADSGHYICDSNNAHQAQEADVTSDYFNGMAPISSGRWKCGDKPTKEKGPHCWKRYRSCRGSVSEQQAMFLRHG
uniref:USP domain-containing protein n=1 Tax=Stegastes partitus TaxID=144197 RepID=A0A3B5AFB2_9TELE